MCTASPLSTFPQRSTLVTTNLLQSLGGEDPLEKEMATHSSILAWESPWKRRLEGYNPWGLQRVPGIMEKHLFYVHFASCQYDKNK